MKDNFKPLPFFFKKKKEKGRNDRRKKGDNSKSLTFMQSLATFNTYVLKLYQISFFSTVQCSFHGVCGLMNELQTSIYT